MKKLIIIYAVIVLIGMVISVIVLDAKYNMRHYFDDWEPETDEEIIHVLSDTFIYYHLESMNLDDYVNGRIEEVYCVKNDRIYFCYSTSDSDTRRNLVWHIASVGINGENLTDHYSGNLFKEPHLFGDSYVYERLSYHSYDENLYGGFYSNDKIYLHGNGGNIVYDIMCGTASEIDEHPIGKYRWRIENHQKITIEDTEQNIFRTITLESMAEQNSYAQKLLELSSRKINTGDSSTYKILSKMKVVDDRIYIVCEVLNWNGESFSIVFRYDFSSEKVTYLSFFKVFDLVDSRYTFAQCEP